jgi:hypothetical protein
MNAVASSAPTKSQESHPDVFISYAREDRELAGHLAHAIEAQGLKVWWDRHIRGGDAFADIIADQLEHARVALVLWSEASVRSTFVRDESSRALEVGKLLPVRIAPVTLPLGFGQIQTLDLLDWDGDEEAVAIKALVDEIARRLSLPPGKPRSNDEIPARPSIMRRWRRPLIAIAVATALGGTGGGAWYVHHIATIKEARESTDQGVRILGAEPPNLQAARDQFQNAIELNRHFARAYFYHAQVLLQTEAGDEGKDDIKKLAAKELRLALAQTSRYGQIDDAQRAEAERWLKRLEGNPEEPPARAAPPAETAVAAGAEPGRGPASERPVAEEHPAGRAGQNRIELAGEPRAKLAAMVDQIFAADKDVRTSTTTSLVVDPDLLSDAVPIAVRKALSLQPQQAGSPAIQSGVVNTLVLLQAASPATLMAHRPEIEELLRSARSNGSYTAGLADKVEALLKQAATRTPLVYIQVGTQDQARRAEALREQLNRAGFSAPAIEVVDPAKVPQVTEIRVQGKSDRGLARWLLQQMPKAGVGEGMSRSLRKVNPANDTYEIWLTRNF